MLPKIIVCGTGYWGINHVRNFSELGHLYGIFDHDPIRAQKASEEFNVKSFSSYDEVLASKEVDGLVIATPAKTHFDLADQAIQAGKHVLVEKPLSLRLRNAQKLVHDAKEKSLTLMVGHLLRYHPCVKALKTLVMDGTLGKIEYVYSNRLNLGKIRSEENILWSFAPHDISLMLWLVDSMPIQVNVVGGSYLQPNIPDTTISTFLFNNGIRGHIFVSWLHPFKEQRLVIHGSKKMAVFDDQAQGDEKLLLFDKNVRLNNGQYTIDKAPPTPIPWDQNLEPLKEECAHFISCIKNKETPQTDGEEGLRVLEILQSCQSSLEMNGQPVQVKRG